jgi:alpha-L-rhamnosidase
MKIVRMKTNRLTNPLGFQLKKKPSLSWIVEPGTAKKQVAARVQVASDSDFRNILFDSGKRADINSICYPLDIELSPRTRYYWNVTVWGDDGSEAAGEPAWFETSKMDEPWQAKWITPDFSPEYHPVLFSEFQLDKKAANARVYICGLGLYEFSLNGEKTGDEYLSPGLVAYDKWIPYQTYDVTGQLKTGTNKIEVSLGNGWYKGRYGLNRKETFRYGDEFALICEIRVTYEDGTTGLFVTDETWKAKKFRVFDSSIFDGEFLDDTFDDATVYSVKLLDKDIQLLEPRRSPPVKIKERLKPVEVIHTPAGETVLDMGQNMVGWLEFTNRAPKGTEVYLQFGEVLQDGNFYRDNLRTAKCEFRYISDGCEKKVRPHFTFYGFRFVKLTQWTGPVNAEDFTGLVLYSDMEQTGNITTDHPLVNRLFLNALWGQKGNYLDVPTDCPQRDERMGWTGDAEVFSGTAAFNMDVFAFFDKYLYDLMQEQKTRGGNVPVVVPAHDVKQNGACAWGDAAVIIPWNMYLYYGDISVLEQQYDSMKGWVDYIHSRDEAAGGKRLWINDFHYGAWLSLDVEDIWNRFGGTEAAFLASAYYSFSSAIVAKAARILNRNDDAEYYRQLSEEVKQAIRKEYFTETGRLAINTQTAHVVALYMDLAPEEWKDRIAFSLRQKLKDSGYHLRTGFIGTPYLCRVLSGNGSNDIAYRLLTNLDYPGWLYPVTMGATTIWERWNSIMPDGKISDTGMNSLNHYAYGSIVEWMYRNAAGIQPVEDAPGFQQFILAPQPNYLLKSVCAEFMSPMGLIVSQWNISGDGSVSFRFRIPFNAKARLILPDSSGTEYEGVHELECGEYSFTYMPSKPYRKSFGIDTSMREIYQNREATAIVEEYLPDMTKWMLFTMLAGERSVSDFIKQGLLSMDAATQAELDEKLGRIFIEQGV